MTKRFGLLFVPLALAALIGVVAASGDPTPSKAQLLKQETPAQLQAEAQAPHTAPAVVTGQATPVSPSTVLSQATQPGAIVESAPGLTPAQATGAVAGPSKAASTAGSSAVAAAEAAISCWSNTFFDHWGTFPQYQNVYDNESWCGHYGGAQTYRVSHVNGATLTCDWNQAYGWLVSGGNGYTWSVARSGAHFTCPTGIPYIQLHFDHWQENAMNTWGNYSFVRDSG